MPQNPASSANVLQAAAERSLHFGSCLEWIGNSLRNSTTYKEAYFNVAQSICAAMQVVFFAVGKSGGVARLTVDMLTSVGVPAKFVHPTEAFHGDFGGVQEKAVALVVSNGGRSQELLSVLGPLREKNCRIVAMTSRADSPLARAADDVLLLPPFAENCPLGQAPITSTVSTLALCQLLVASTIELRSFSLADYAQNHPGGAIGKRIFVKVDDVMIKGAQLPLVGPHAPFAECVSKMTQYSCAALLVVDSLLTTRPARGDNEGEFAGAGSQLAMSQAPLLGLISEKDLRVAMEKHGAGVFNCTAENFMNAKPIVMRGGALAVDALAVMENRPRPLNILPIVNEENHVLGLLRVHDLILQGITLS